MHSNKIEIKVGCRGGLHCLSLFPWPWWNHEGGGGCPKNSGLELHVGLVTAAHTRESSAVRMRRGGGGAINLRVLKSRKTDMQYSKTAD